MDNQMENNKDTQNTNENQHETKQEKSGLRTSLLLLAALLILCFLAFGFLYWFQMKPENKENLEKITGADLSAIDTIARNVGNQTNTVLSLTPLGEALRTQNEIRESQSEEVEPSQESNIPDEDNLETFTFNNNETIQGEQTLAQTTTESSSNTSQSAPTSTDNSTQSSTAAENEEDSANIIQPPSNVSELNLVTEASPEEQARIDEEERLKAIADIEALLANQQNHVPSLPSSNKESSAPSAPSPFEGPVDKVIGANFIQDIAYYLVHNYSLSKGLLTSPIAINIRYGANLRALPSAGNTLQARAYILDYAYNAHTLQNLYALYEERFIHDLNNALSERSFSANEKEAFYKALAHFTRQTAVSVQNILNVSSRKAKAEELLRVKNAELQAEDTFASYQVAYEEARANNGDIESIRDNMVEAAEEIEKASARLQVTQGGILNDIKQQGNAAFSNNTLLYAFEWLHRREMRNEEANAANQELLNLLLLLAERLDEEI